CWAPWEAFDERTPGASDDAAAGIPGGAGDSAAAAAEQPVVGAGGFAVDVPRCAAGSGALRPEQSGRAVRDRLAVDCVAGYPFRDLGERGERLADSAFDVPDAHLRADFVALHSKPRQGVLRVFAAPGIRPDRRISGAGPVPVLRVLGSVVGAHVFPDRHLGA